MTLEDPLNLFLPAVREWFRAELGEPTLPQRQGWPAIAEGKNTLILAPTGSGKTLAAFLVCLDNLWRQPSSPREVKILYISPLKALNNDIHRNLQVPLEGVARTARNRGETLPELLACVRTGDTSSADRQRQIRKPPDILITTPESLHILLTSRARETLRGLTHVIVDEIHALCGNKRGVFLALLLERLEALQRGPGSFLRIGLSATQRPLDEVARYLGGLTFAEDGTLQPRPVFLVDGGLRKDVDLAVLNPVEQFGPQPERSIWPAIYRLLIDQVKTHRSTIIFTNDRRSSERITSFLNENEPIARAHHGSVDLERRQEIEAALKEGRLPAVCATASLELGIDMGAVELVCQVARPGNVARALQRVGRAGHLVGQKSKGRFIPRMASDLLEQAVLVREMREGHVEPIEVPVNCLDVLAQQIVAMTAMEDWSVPDLYARIRQAYPYRDLSPQVFETTLEMVSGRYRFLPEEGPSRARLSSLEALQPRVSWDRVHNRLAALPGSQSLALLHGGTIPDTGQYAAYLANGTRLGELDEEFIFERRVGDTFLLGTNAWKLDRIEPDRVIVVPAEGAPAIVPFWRGEGQGRSHGLGQAIGAFLREAEHRLTDDDFTDWLMRDFALDRRAAQSLHLYLQRQILTVGCLPSDQTLVVEASRDQLGDWQVILLSPLGQRPHLALRFALEGALRERLGYHPQCLHHDDGVLIRLTDSEEPVLDLLTGITEDNVEELILRELADSALFAIRFRQNAARSLLMPRGKAGQRAPLWLQRLRGRDLLQVARRHPDFPVVVETYRECLRDYLDVPKVQELLREVREGRIRLVTRRLDQPSPFASTLLFSFTAANMYQYDQVEPEGESAQHLDRDALAQMIRPEDQEHLLDPRAIHQVERRLRGMGHPPRSETEMAEWLRRLGDLGPDDLHGPMDTFLDALTRNGVAREIHLPGVPVGQRWILAEEEPIYQQAFFASSAPGETRQQAASRILLRFLETHALVALDDVLRRYPFDRDWVNRQLEGWLRQGRAVAVGPHRSAEARFSSPENLDHIQRSSLGLLRREVIPCQPTQFQVFLQQWQKVYPGCQRTGPQRLLQTLEQMQGFFLPVEIWERAVLPARMQAFQPRELGDWIAGGGGVWIGRGQGERGVEEITFLPRNLMTEMGPPTLAESSNPAVDRVAAFLEHRGASFLTDLALDSGLSPGETRRALWALVRAGRVSNDQFDVVRRGEPEDVAEVLSSRGPTSRTLRSLRRAASQQTEGRWSLLRWGRPTPEQLALTQCHLGLQWFGVLTRELALLAGWLLPWRILYEVLSRLELAGEVRRGYFIEGMSGAQFALPEVVELLQQQHLPANLNAPMVLLHSQDPSNLYGSGAPLDIPLLAGGTRPFLRRPGNWLVLRLGRPVLLIEQKGKRLTALASASSDDVLAAVRTLPQLLGTTPGVGIGGNRLIVEQWNEETVTSSPGRELLEAAGFVRDYQGMALYPPRV